MGRIPCCEKGNVKRGQWTPEEDTKLSSYIAQHGTRNWRVIPKNAGLQRCGKSCRLRWTNYLRPDLKHGEFSESQEQAILTLHSVVGRWSLIAAQLPGRTDNDVKNLWNTKLKKKLSGMGIDPVTHKPFSLLMIEIANTLPPPQVAHLSEAALGCFKDEMLHFLTKRRPLDFPLASPTLNTPSYRPNNDDTVHKIKLGLSRAIMHDPIPADNGWDIMVEPSDGLAGMCNAYQTMCDGYRYRDGMGSVWNQSVCTGSTCTGGTGDQKGGGLGDRGDDDDGEESQGGKLSRKDDVSMFGSNSVLWDLSDDLMNPMISTCWP